MPANGKATAINGVVSVTSSMYEWRIVGSTCPTTLRPEMGYVKGSFKIFPNKVEGENSEDLVLAEALYAGYIQYSLFHIKRKADGVVRVTENPSDAKDLVGAGVNFQVVNATGSIELQVGDTRYTTDTKAQAGHGENVMRVDASSILRFIAGHMTIDDLRQNALRIETKEVVEAGFYQLLGELNVARYNEQRWKLSSGAFEQEVATLKQQVESLDGLYQQAAEDFLKMRDARDVFLSRTADMDKLAMQLSRLPKLLREIKIVDDFLRVMKYFQFWRGALQVDPPYIDEKL